MNSVKHRAEAFDPTRTNARGKTTGDGGEKTQRRIPKEKMGGGASATGRGYRTRRDAGRSVLLYLLPVLGTLCLGGYVLQASVDVVYSDYIRLINSYLPDPLAPEHFFVPDILTRIPITYLIRFLNIHLFGFSVHFDRALSLLGLLLLMLSVSAYLRRERAGILTVLAVMLLGFSLDKWELLLNGSGCAHFLSYGLFFYHYLVLERAFTGTEKPGDERRLVLLPWLALLVAGPYLVQYAVTLLLAYGYLAVLHNRQLKARRLSGYALSALLPLILYLMSNASATYDYVGTKDIGLLTVLQQHLGFSLRFLLDGFASTLVSGSVLEDFLAAGHIQYREIYLLGALVILLYLLALGLYFRTGQYRRTIFPMLLLVSGAGSHVLVFLSRYIYFTETYAWQSRYGLQYLPGTLGLLLIYGYAARVFRAQHEKRVAARAGLVLSIFVLLSFMGASCYTDKREMDVAPFRKMYFETIAESARNYENLSDDELNVIFEYHHGAGKVRHALDILKENHWNVFRE